LDEWFVGMYRNYERLVEDKLPDVIHNCIQFMRSEAFFLILSNLTGLRLHRLAVTSPDTDEEDKEPSSADVGPGIDCTLTIQALTAGATTIVLVEDGAE